MRVDVLKIFRLRMARSVAALAFASLAAGCSSDVARFDDGFYTGAVPRQDIPRTSSGPQAYPGDVDRMNTGSVRSGLPMPSYGSNPGAGVQTSSALPQNDPYEQTMPVRTASVERTMLAPPSTAPEASYPQAGTSAPVAPAQAPVPAVMPQPAQPAIEAPTRGAMKAGWNNTGTSVSLRNGETVETLAKRYGVPAKAILSVNGMKSSAEARPGQPIIIPSYSYGDKAAPAAPTPAPAAGLGAAPAPLRAPAPAAGSKGATIVVEAGDSLNGIARRNGVSASDLRSANGLEGDNIRIGQKLVLPGGASPAKRVAAVEPKAASKPAPEKPAPKAVQQPKPYEAPRAESPAAAAAVAPAKAAEPVKAAPEPAKAAPASSVAAESQAEVATAAPTGTGIEQFRWPVQGRVVKRFGEKNGARRNDGLNISVPRGTPVKAAENGVVIYAGDGLKEFGNTVLVKHANGLVTVYGHADDLKVKRGATVKRGQEIATAGVSGETNTPMVHFEVRKDSAPVDPMTFLQ